MKNFLSWLIKAFISGIIALILLTGFSAFYYNVPLDTEDESGATDYAWKPHTFYSRGTEGFSVGKTNNEGYLNTYDYSPDMDINVLVVGSSHMEAYQVAMDESTTAVLGQLMPDKNVYNIGISAHTLMVCSDNLEAAVEKYAPSEYVILETASLFFTNDQLREAIDGTVSEIPANDGGIVGALKRNPYIRLIHTQFQNFMSTDNGGGNSDQASEPPLRGDDSLYDELLAKLKATVSKTGARLIIMYHPSIYLNEDGSLFVDKDEELTNFFATHCEKNEVEFLDMTQRFIEGYEENLTLPHGFTNSSVGTGHLNRYGHAMIAEALYDLMKEGE